MNAKVGVLHCIAAKGVAQSSLGPEGTVSRKLRGVWSIGDIGNKLLIFLLSTVENLKVDENGIRASSYRHTGFSANNKYLGFINQASGARPKCGCE